MTPISLSITNFGPFRETQTFEFPREPGLYFMWGENQHEPRLEANGAGKSKLWEALVWVIFGKTSRGLKAGDAANWEAGKGACVEFSYLVDSDPGLPATITRTWGPNSWTWKDWMGEVHDLAKDSNPVRADLRLEFTPFLNSVLMAQGEPLFLDLKAEAKAQLFASVMDLDRWLEYSQKASKKAAEHDLVCRRLEKDLATITGNLESMEGTPLDDLSERWERDRSARLAQLETEHQDLAERESKARPAHETWVSFEAECRAVLKLASVAAEKEISAMLSRQGSGEKLRQELAVNELRLGQANDRIKFFKDHEHCPTCDQDLSPAVRRMKLTQAEEERERLHDILTKIEDDIDELARARNSAEEVRNGARKRLSQAQEGVDEAQAKTRDSRLSLDRLASDLDSIEEEAAKLINAVNPYACLIAEQDDERAELRSQVRSTQRRLEDTDSQFRLAGSWVKWFKEIRLSLIAEALEQLEIEVNNCINALGLVSWELHFDVDRENKSGSIQRGFNVFVQAPHNNRAVPWEAWSGGEGQRLRVAAQQGLANLIRQRTGTKFNLEVWDEPTQWMSAQGVTDLLDSLALRAEAEQRQIWIVDHRTLGYSNFKGSCGVIKGRDGSSRFDLNGLYKSGHEQPTNVAGDPPHDVVRKRTRAK